MAPQRPTPISSTSTTSTGLTGSGTAIGVGRRGPLAGPFDASALGRHAARAPHTTSLPVCAMLLLLSFTKLAAGFTICGVHDPPFTICPSSDFDGFVQDEKTIRGVDVEMLRWMLTDQGYTWNPDAGYADPKYKKYSWRCSPGINWHQTDISSRTGNISSGPWPQAQSPPPPPSPSPPDVPPGDTTDRTMPYPFPCDINTGDITRLSIDAVFQTISVPYFETGAGILTLSSGSVKDPWAFIKPFHWSLWLAFVGFAIVIPATSYFTERLSMDGAIMVNSQGLKDWRLAQYQTFLAVFNLQVYPVASLAAQINIVSFCFLILIVIQTYNAQLGALFTNAEQSASINSINDLKGKKVGTFVDYTTTLQTNYPDVTFVPYAADNTDEMLAKAMKSLNSGEISAFVFDVASFVYRLASLKDHCKYKMITDHMPYKFTYGFLFHRAWNHTQVMKEFFYSVWRAKEAFIDVDLQDKYIGTMPSCSGLAAADGITFMQMSGLFVVVGAITGATLLSGLVTMALRVYQGMQGDGEEGEGDGKGGALVGSARSGKRSMSAALSKVFVRQPSAVLPATAAHASIRQSFRQSLRTGSQHHVSMRSTNEPAAAAPVEEADFKAADCSLQSQREPQAPLPLPVIAPAHDDDGISYTPVSAVAESTEKSPPAARGGLYLQGALPPLADSSTAIPAPILTKVVRNGIGSCGSPRVAGGPSPSPSPRGPALHPEPSPDEMAVLDVLEELMDAHDTADAARA